MVAVVGFGGFSWEPKKNIQESLTATIQLWMYLLGAEEAHHALLHWEAHRLLLDEGQEFQIILSVNDGFE